MYSAGSGTALGSGESIVKPRVSVSSQETGGRLRGLGPKRVRVLQ